MRPFCRRWAFRLPDTGIEKAVSTSLNLPLAPIETACEDKKSTVFHLLFAVTPSTPGNTTADWEKLAEESLASMYGIIVRNAFLYKPSILILSASRS
jgi:hypothetical protein